MTDGSDKTGIIVAFPRQQVARSVTVNFSEEAYQALLRLAIIRRTTMSEALSAAIGFMSWMYDEHDQGREILIKQGNVGREIIFKPRDGTSPPSP